MKQFCENNDRRYNATATTKRKFCIRLKYHACQSIIIRLILSLYRFLTFCFSQFIVLKAATQKLASRLKSPLRRIKNRICNHIKADDEK